MIKREFIRNFAIISHIDHGKSTLADRILELTRTLPAGKHLPQVLDQMDLERERGITIKASAVRISHRGKDGREYLLNLIDTPGHVDFTYEVSRTLAACEGALLLVDAAQGVEAQTVANAFLAKENDLKIIPVINKIDLPNAQPERVKKEIEEALGIESKDALLVSAKTGEGVSKVLEAVIEQIPPPPGSVEKPLKALVFDSFFDSYRGVVAYIRVFDGSIKPGMQIRMMATGRMAEVEEVGVFRPEMESASELVAGGVGYLISGIKSVRETKVGDTVTDAQNPALHPLEGYREAKPMVFCGLYPVEGGEYEELRQALEKLRLNDSSFVFQPETSLALGMGFRCGFLGLLHMEIVKERLEREYGLGLVTSAPSVVYTVAKTDGSSLVLRNPSQLPVSVETKEISEPWVAAVVLTPPEYIGSVMELCQERRGEFKGLQYLSENRAEIKYDLPLSEILLDFFDRLKSKTRGYASLDYEHTGERTSELVRLDLLLAGDPIDALSSVVHKDKAYQRGKNLVERLAKVIPRQLFEVPIQAAIGRKVIARATVKPLRKDVTAKLYGGDVTRKRKLLERQKAGKKRMKQIGQIEVPEEAFMQVLKVEE